MERNSVRKIITVWLWIGLVMIFIQVLLGSVTRLTGSGLSITKWDIVTGILYPSTTEKWQSVFEDYKKTPQYQKINLGMNIKEFKFIFFWEYFHRLWARLMGLIFIVPFSYFFFTKRLKKGLVKDLMIVFLLACLVASLGWIMVVSGLVNRPWVNAFKLSFHLMMAVILISYLYWTILKSKFSIDIKSYFPFSVSRGNTLLLILLFFQLFLGGVMSGMRAGIVAPTWPDINGVYFPLELKFITNNDLDFFGNYESNHMNGIIIQFFHRMTAYLIYALTWFLGFYHLKRENKSSAFNYFRIAGLLSIQLLLGIITVLQCVGSVPLLWAVLHQIFGIICFLYVLLIFFKSGMKSEKVMV